MERVDSTMCSLSLSLSLRQLAFNLKNHANLEIRDYFSQANQCYHSDILISAIMSGIGLMVN